MAAEAVVEPAEDTAAVREVAAPAVAGQEAEERAEVREVGRAAVLEAPVAAEAGLEVAPAAVELVSAARSAILRTIRHDRLFRSFLRRRPRISK